MKSTFGLTTTRTSAVTAARGGVMVAKLFIHFGEWSERLRVIHLYRPNATSSAPATMRAHDAHGGGGLSSPPPSRLDPSRKICVTAASATTQPTR